MIPVHLRKGLKKRLENVFEGVSFKSPNPEPGKERTSLSIFEQNLPQKSKDDISFFPFVNIKLMSGEQKNAGEASDVSVGFIIGTFDADPDNQGSEDVSQIISRIMESLTTAPLIDGQFELQFPLRWRIHEEETDPYFFGVIETSWKAASYTRTDVEVLI